MGAQQIGQLLLWSTKDRTSYWFEFSNLEGASAKALAMRGQMDVYFGVGLREQVLDKNKRGASDDVISIPGLWVDIDIADGTHQRGNLPTSLAEAQQLLGKFPLKPSLVLHTGAWTSRILALSRNV